MKHFLWPDVSGHPTYRVTDPELTHLSVALQYGIATVQAKDASPEALKRIKANIEKLAQGQPPSGYRQSVIDALEARLNPPPPQRGWENTALAD